MDSWIEKKVYNAARLLKIFILKTRNSKTFSIFFYRVLCRDLYEICCDFFIMNILYCQGYKQHSSLSNILFFQFGVKHLQIYLLLRNIVETKKKKFLFTVIICSRILQRHANICWSLVILNLYFKKLLQNRNKSEARKPSNEKKTLSAHWGNFTWHHRWLL